MAKVLNEDYYFQVVTRSLKPEDIELQVPCIHIFHKDTWDKESRNHYDIENKSFAEDTNTMMNLLKTELGSYITKEFQSAWYDNNDRSMVESHIEDIKKYMKSIGCIENNQRFHNKKDIFHFHKQYSTIRKASFCNKDFSEDITTNGGEQQVSIVQIPSKLFNIFIEQSPENFNVLQMDNWALWDYDAMTLLMQELQTLQIGTILQQSNISIFPLHCHISKNACFDFQVDKILEDNTKLHEVLKSVCIFEDVNTNERLEALADFYQSLVDLDDIIKE